MWAPFEFWARIPKANILGDSNASNHVAFRTGTVPCTDLVRKSRGVNESLWTHFFYASKLSEWKPVAVKARTLELACLAQGYWILESDS